MSNAVRGLMYAGTCSLLGAMVDALESLEDELDPEDAEETASVRRKVSALATRLALKARELVGES